jgi:hypothetical protein
MGNAPERSSILRAGCLGGLRAIALAGFAVSVAGCGAAAPAVRTPSPTPTSTPTAMPTPTPAPVAKFIAVLGGQVGPGGTEVLTILDHAGVQHGSVSFVPPPLPIFRNSIAAVQAPAVTAAGRAFFIDSGGSVSSLAPDGSPVKVASFPFRTGEEISFAVSPDASQVVAIVVAMSNERATGYSVYLATAGGATTMVRGPVSSSSIPRLLTWIAAGPVVVTDAASAYQGCELGECEPWGHAVLVDPATGVFGSAVGGSDCAIWDVNDAAVLCSSGPVAFAAQTPPNLSVRTVDGSSSRTVAITTRCGGCYYDARLSPNGDVALQELRPSADLNSQSSAVIGSDGTTRVVAGQGDFAPYLWFDAQTVVGVTDCSSVGCTVSGGSLAAVGTSGTVLQSVSLGLSGTPVGVLVE